MAKNRRSNVVSSALLGVAAIQGIVGLMGWWMYSWQFRPIDWLVTFSFAIYGALAIWARWKPTTAALNGMLLYGAFLALQGLTSVKLLFTGLQFKVPIVVLLLVALCAALWQRTHPATVTR
jgi:hypothetical protein